MNEMIKIHKTRIEREEALIHQDQRSEDRRKEPCEGNFYISIVGWICRRERIRRKAIDAPQ